MEQIGTKLQFQSCVATKYELDNCTHIEMTCKVEWNPHSVELSLENAKTVQNLTNDKIMVDNNFIF